MSKLGISKVKLPSRGSMLRKLLIIIPVVLVLTLVSIFMPARRVSIEGIGRLSFETAVNLSVGQETAYASPDIEVDAVSYGTGTSSPITVEHTTGSGSNLLMLVGISTFSGDTNSISSIKYNNKDLTLVGTEENYSSDSVQIWIYRLVAPDIGTYNLVVDFSDDPGFGGVVGVSTFTGVDQDNPLGSFVSDIGTSSPATVDASSAEGELVFDTLSTWADSASVETGQTERWNQLSSYVYGAGSTEPGAATVTMSWTLTNPSYWAIGAVPIKPAAAEAGIAFVNETHGYGAGSDTTIAASAASHTAGNLLVVIVVNHVSGYASVSSISDTAGNTYTYATKFERSDTSTIEIWYAKNISGNANNVVTATFSTSTYYREISVLQYSGADTSDPYDVSNTGYGSGTSQTTDAATTTYADEVIVAGYYEGNTGTFTAGTNFTVRYDGTYLGTEDRIVSSIGSYGSEITYSASESYMAIHATFKAAAEAEAGWLTGWCKRVKITIDHNDFDEDATHFPLLIYLSDSCGIDNDDLTPVFDEVGANSKKIAVTEDDGETQLYVEIEKWDETAEEAWLWVSRDGWTISSSEDTYIYLYYCSTQTDNDTYVGDSGSRTEVWNSDYQGVWHLKEGGTRLVMVTSDGTYDNGYDSDKKTFFESLGYTVSVIAAGDAQGTYDSAASSNDVMFIADTSDSSPGTKARDLDICIVSEEISTWRDLMYGSNTGTMTTNDTQWNITDNSHYITSPFGTGNLTVYSSSSTTSDFWATTLPAGAQVLAKPSSSSTSYALIAFEQGAELFDSHTAANRRVLVSTGSSDYTYWTDDLKTLLGRSLKWGGKGEIHYDSTSNANNGISSGNTPATGKIANGQDFDGSDDYVDCGTDSSLDLGAGDFSISAWAKSSYTGSELQVITSNHVESSWTGWMLSIENSGLYLFYTIENPDSTQVYSTSTADTGWHHIAGVRDNTDHEIYVDGAWEATTSGTVRNVTNSENTYIAYEDDPSQWDQFEGTLDEVRISDSARSAAWIEASYETQIDDMLDFGSEETEEEEAGWLDDWCKRVKITIDHNDFDEDATHFPLLIYLSTSSGREPDDVSFVFDELGANSKKIAVTEDDGTTQLYVEIEKWDETAEEAWLWVSKSDWTISSTVDTYIYLYYCNTQPENTDYVGDVASTPAQNVWDSNYKAVYHLSETAGGGSSTIEVDGTVSTGTGTDPITVEHTTGSGTNLLMLVGISYYNYSTEPIIDSVTYGSQSLTLVDENSYSGRTKASIYQLVAPASGTANVVVDFSSAPTWGGVGVITFTGVDQNDPLGTPDSDGSWSDTAEVTVSSASGELVFDTLSCEIDMTMDPSQTERWSVVRSGTDHWAKASTKPGDTSVTMSWTYTSENQWALVAVPIKPAAASGAVKDSTANANHGTDSGDPTFGATGEIDSAIDFDGGDDYVDVPDDNSLDVTNVTLSAWVKSDTTGRYIIAKDPPDTEILRPNAAGDEENIFQSYPITGEPHWEMVDEEVADDLTTYLRDDEDWHLDLYNLPSHSEGSGTINYIKVYARCEAESTPNMTSLKIAIKTGGTVYESSEITITTDWVDYSNQWDENPGGGAWTWDDIDALQIGLWLQRCNTSWEFSYCTQVYVEVDYTPAAAKSDMPYALSTVGGGQFMFISSDTTYSANSTTDINDGQWHHLTGTYDGETIRLYVASGLEDTNTDPSGNLPTNDGNVRIGADYQTTPANFFSGTLDEVRISDSARSAAWVKATYETEIDDMLDFGSEETSGVEPNISNLPTSYDFGNVTDGQTYPTGLDYFTVTNNSGAAVDITIQGTDMQTAAGGGGYPDVEATATSYESTATTSHTVSLAADIQSGELLFIVFGSYVVTTVNTPSGWTQLGSTDEYNSYIQMAQFYKTATGSEGSTVTVTTDGSTKSSHVCYRISGWTGTPEKGTAATSINQTPDPPSLTPSWGSAQTLWIAVETNRMHSAVTAWPTSYDDDQINAVNSSTTTSSSTGMCTRSYEASSDDPGTFTIESTRYAIANTIAVQPSGGTPYIWTLSDDCTPGSDIIGFKAGLDGGSYNITVKKNSPYNDLVTGLGDEASQSWGLQLYTPTNITQYGEQLSGTITLTATLS